MKTQLRALSYLLRPVLALRCVFRVGGFHAQKDLLLVSYAISYRNTKHSSCGDFCLSLNGKDNEDYVYLLYRRASLNDPDHSRFCPCMARMSTNP